MHWKYYYWNTYFCGFQKVTSDVKLPNGITLLTMYYFNLSNNYL